MVICIISNVMTTHIILEAQIISRLELKNIIMGKVLLIPETDFQYNLYIMKNVLTLKMLSYENNKSKVGIVEKRKL